jgi:hypothetical protein
MIDFEIVQLIREAHDDRARNSFVSPTVLLLGPKEYDQLKEAVKYKLRGEGKIPLEPFEVKTYFGMEVLVVDKPYYVRAV